MPSVGKLLGLLAVCAQVGRTHANPTCKDGMEWNECGSPCTPTCENPGPMCMMVCQAKCECPKTTPILKDGRCITEAACTSTSKTVPTPSCTPNPNVRCPRIYQPVCAGGKTYANACLADAECKTTSYEGACLGADV
uniref:Kazal-like domain-containing protein n=1 Tax=Coccolithus braarudii TaxID=221442 RepID=A0A7S0LRT3_9EUKA|mmetsp:Transcript_7167/g.15702  ORF Transcript_7167/g.15702 Transcript_7167/m.15702 type:complete len:137 (+) Transcript_7167:44-454(+)